MIVEACVLWCGVGVAIGSIVCVGRGPLTDHLFSCCLAFGLGTLDMYGAWDSWGRSDASSAPVPAVVGDVGGRN